MTRRHSTRLAAMLTIAAVTLTGCAAAESAGHQDHAAHASWPRTVEVGGHEVDIASEPQRIAALSTETGDLALGLVGHERIVAVSNGSVTPGAGNQIDEAKLVGTALPTGTSPDPEQILSLDPDLVLMTSRHEGEEDAAKILESSGVPVLVFDNSDFESLDGVIASIDLLGTALGAETAATTITENMASERDAILATVEHDPIDTTVLLLMSRGGKQFIQARSTAMTSLVELAGGTIVGAAPHAIPASPELIVKAAPDVIIVEDFQGQGITPFSELFDRPALADVSAVANGQVHTVSAAIASATSGTRTLEGLAQIIDIIHPAAR